MYVSIFLNTALCGSFLIIIFIKERVHKHLWFLSLLTFWPLLLQNLEVRLNSYHRSWCSCTYHAPGLWQGHFCGVEKFQHVFIIRNDVNIPIWTLGSESFFCQFCATIEGQIEGKGSGEAGSSSVSATCACCLS